MTWSLPGAMAWIRPRGRGAVDDRRQVAVEREAGFNERRKSYESFQ